MGEGVYLEIKRRVLAGRFRLRERLDVGAIARSLDTSATPVREALIRLVAERLIEQETRRGFYLRLWSEIELAALYEWRGALARIAVDSYEGAQPVRLRGSYPARAGALFQHLEARANPELRRAGAGADERLHAARLVEPQVFEDADREQRALEGAAACTDRGVLLAALGAYHARRIAHVGAIRGRALIRALNNAHKARGKAGGSEDGP